MDLSDEQKNKLLDRAEEATWIREFCRHPGFKLYKTALEDIISDKKNTWLKGSEEDAKMARFEARGVQRALDELKKFIVNGDHARQILDSLAKEGEQGIEEN